MNEGERLYVRDVRRPSGVRQAFGCRYSQALSVFSTMPRARLLFALAALAVLAVLPATLAQSKAEKLGIKPTKGAPARTPIKALPLTSRQQGAPRPKRSAPHIVTECMLVTSDEGHFFVKSAEDSEQVCGVYFMSDPDRVVQLHFDYFDVPCEGGGLVAFVDGWELSGQVFPSPSDHQKPFDDRFEEFCGVPRIKQILSSSQNAALLQYRLPHKGQTFSFTVRHALNPHPCNILSEGTTSVYTLRNYGRKVNCSLTAMFPARVRVLAMQVGVPPFHRTEVETGLLHKCRKRGLDDYLEVGGTLGLDNTHLTVAQDLCGLDSKPEGREGVVLCPMTTARLVSGGESDNSVTVTVQPAGPEDIDNYDVLCEF